MLKPQTFGTTKRSFAAHSPAQLAAMERRRRVAAEAECHKEATKAAAMDGEIAITLSLMEDVTFEQQLRKESMEWSPDLAPHDQSPKSVVLIVPWPVCFRIS